MAAEPSRPRCRSSHSRLPPALLRRPCRYTAPSPIEADDLSLGWAKILLRIKQLGNHEISPLMFTLTGFDADGVAKETPGIREISTVS